MKSMIPFKRFAPVLCLTASCLSSCAEDNTPFKPRDQWAISPRNYVSSLGPNDRTWGEAAINNKIQQFSRRGW